MIKYRIVDRLYKDGLGKNMNKSNLARNKTLIIGCGRLGSSIANKDSSSGKNVIVMDSDPMSFEKLSEGFSGFTLSGDSTDMSLLKEADIDSAYEIIIATGDDNTNIFLALVARKIYDVPQIYVRLDDPSLEVLLDGCNVHSIHTFDLSLNKFLQMRQEEDEK